MIWINIYESDYRLPEKVCVVAPGPQGRHYYHQIPEDYSVIVVSKAVLIPEITELAMSKKDGKLSVTVPQFSCHTAVSFEYE